MIGKGLKEYILIRIVITGFRLIAPTSLLYLAVSFHQSKFPVSTPLGLYAVFEAAFYLFVYLPRSHHIQKVRQSRSDILIHLSNTHLGCSPSPTFNFWRAPTSLQEMQILYFQTRLSQWMVPFRLLKFKETERYPLDSLGSVLNRIMLAGMGGRNQPIPYRSRTYPRLSIRQRLQRRTASNATYIWSCCYAASTTCLVYRKSWQFLNAIVLNNWNTFFQIVGSVDLWSSFSIRTRGFKHYSTQKWFHSFPPRPQTILSEKSVDSDLPYWYRPHRSTTKSPILFLHGIGVQLCSPVFPHLRVWSNYYADRHMDLSALLLRLDCPRPRHWDPNNWNSPHQHAYDIPSLKPQRQLSRHITHHRIPWNIASNPCVSLIWHNIINSHTPWSLAIPSGILNYFHWPHHIPSPSPQCRL